MKTSKSVPKICVQEECGVWLDTAQLKAKAKQKRLARPISKLLNPFLGGGGYKVAVALNFTQTKVEMRKTKQSTISTFFTPQKRDLNKMPTSEVPNVDPALSLISASNAPTSVSADTKRRHQIYQNVHNSESDAYHNLEFDNVPEAAVWQEQRANPPQSKRRLTASSLLPDQSQDPLFPYSQYSEGKSYHNNQKNTTTTDLTDSEPCSFNGLRSENAFGLDIDIKATTSTQRSFKHILSSVPDDEKENCFLSAESPNKHSNCSSSLKWTDINTTSPRKHIPVDLQKVASKEYSHGSQFKRTKARSSPLKPPQLSCKTVDEDSLAMLFTQDSEGFRVIAHRGLQERSPIKDQHNFNSRMERTSAFKSLLEEEEEEMLFTQDSQGNMVIKH